MNTDLLVCNGNLNPVMSESPIVDLRLLNVAHHDLLTFWPERTLQHLETLHLDCRNTDERAPGAGNFLGSLTLPKLSTIRFTGYSGKLLPALFALISRSLSRSSCMLTTLELCHPLTSTELVSLSRVASSLETLLTCLPLCADSAGLLQLACRPESNTPPLLPNLQKLHFFVVENYYLEDDYLTDVQIEGLTQIAETRCEIEEPRTRQRPALGKLRRLQDFRIVFPNVGECNAGQEALEAKRPYSLSPRSIQRLKFLENWLESNFYNLFNRSNGPPLTRKNTQKRLPFARFGGVERICHVEDVAELYVCDGYRSAVSIGIHRQWQESGIHHFMHDIYHNMDSPRISDGHRKKAGRILDKFTPLLLNDVRNRKWSYQGVHSICYVSNDNCMIFVSSKSCLLKHIPVLF